MLKIRYWVIGGAVGGGVALRDKYENFRKQLPDFSEFLPDETANNLNEMWDRIKTNANLSAGIVTGAAHTGVERANTWLLELEKKLGSQIRDGIPDPGQGVFHFGTSCLSTFLHPKR